jgi:hypothetical protein
MDPITALGAAGSVVGIAGFGIQLSQTLYEFIRQVASADQSLRAVWDGVYAVSGALEQAHSLVEEESTNVAQGMKLLLFTPKALGNIKGIVDQCLLIF